MMTTKYGDHQVKITMPDDLKKSIVQFGVNHLELYRLLQSFSDKLLASKEDGTIFLENEDTGARLEVEIKWAPADKQVMVTVVNVDMTRVKPEQLSGRPRGAKFDFNDPAAK